MTAHRIDIDALTDCLRSIGLDDWAATLPPLVGARFAPGAHGDLERWLEALDGLDAAAADTAALESTLLALSPWRKGPFDLGAVHIDSEWRSDLKWDRLADRVAPLEGRHVLDVGCGNGFYAFRMREAGATAVIGVDPTLLYVVQFLAVNHYARDDGVFVLPLRLSELPLPAKHFDSTFSMGVLYHQRGPIEHLRELRQTLRPGGQLVLETLFVPGKKPYAFTPSDRYARMKNVWLLPTIAELETWLSRTGYRDIDVVDTSVTTTDEQRSTRWMPFESLAEALDPGDSTRTVEGWPAPRRVVVTATTP